MMWRLTSLWGVVFISIGALADSGSAQVETENPPILETGLSAKILNQAVFTPFRRQGLLRESSRSVYVITQEQIEAQGARTVQEALKYLPGILSDGTAGTQLGALSSQFMRGGNSSQVLILLDGRPINDLGFFGGFDLSELTTDSVERIEVSPGGGSTLYGSDAVGGVINIITLEAGLSNETRLRAAVGSYGLNEEGIQTGGQSDNLGWILSYQRLEAENDFPFTIERLNQSGTRQNAAVEYNTLQAKLTWEPTESQTFSLNALYLNKDLGVPGSLEFPSSDATQLTNDLLTDLSWESRTETSTLRARVSVDSLNYRFRADSQGTQDAVQRTGIGSQVQYDWQIAPDLSFTGGIDYRSIAARNTTANFLEGSTNLNYDETVSQTALFGRLDYSPLLNLNVNLGVRQDFNSLINGSATSPSVGIRWSLSDSTSLRANYASSFRTPLISELFVQLRGFFAVDGNPNLRPERGDSWEVGWDQALGDTGLFRLTFASNRIRDGIAFVFTGESSGTYENIGLVEYTGLEAALDLQLAPQWFLFANYTLNDPRIRSAQDPSTINKELAFIGAETLNIGLTYRSLAGFSGSLLLHQVGSVFTNNSNSASLPGYTTVAANVEVPVAESFSLRATVDNLFDQQYEVFPGFPGIGRTVRLGLQGEF
jgi:vitamin B12 transporter